MIFLCLFQLSSNNLLHEHCVLNFLKSLFDTMLKRYQKKKKEIFSSPNAFLGQDQQKIKKKMSKNEFSLLIISICRIYPKMYYHFYYKEDFKM